jgi:hypothetical protein
MLVKTTKAVTTYPEGQQAIKEAAVEGFVLTGIIMNPKDLALYNKAAYSFSTLSIDDRSRPVEWPYLALESSRAVVEGSWLLIYTKPPTVGAP